jgi:hypothetical protein
MAVLRLPSPTCSACPFETLNLSANQPKKFNDPFDCNFRTIVDELCEDEITCVINDLVAMDRLTERDAKLYLENGKPNSRAKDKIKELEPVITRMIDCRQKVYYENLGVACFTARKARISMWSHYADNHKGFCLEFDTSFEPFRTAHGEPRVLTSICVTYLLANKMLLSSYLPPNLIPLPLKESFVSSS